jgi:hypothetical protein
MALLGLAILSGLFLTVLPGTSLGAQAVQNTGSQQPEPTPGASAPAAPRPNSSDTTQEMNTRDSTTPFSVRVNLVPIRVVVRDAHGLAVSNLPQDDFRVSRMQPQLISHFSVETPAPRCATTSGDKPISSGRTRKLPAALVWPARFVALLFDDVHLPFESWRESETRRRLRQKLFQRPIASRSLPYPANHKPISLTIARNSMKRWKASSHAR